MTSAEKWHFGTLPPNDKFFGNFFNFKKDAKSSKVPPENDIEIPDLNQPSSNVPMDTDEFSNLSPLERAEKEVQYYQNQLLLLSGRLETAKVFKHQNQIEVLKIQKKHIETSLKAAKTELMGCKAENISYASSVALMRSNLHKCNEGKVKLIKEKEEMA